MSDFFNKYPYTDFHEMNLDWIIERVKKLTEDWAATLEEWNSTEDQWQQLYDYVHDYFDNLDVQQEINNKINAMIADGTFVTITTPVIEAKVVSMMPGTVAAQIGDTVAGQIGGTVASQLPGVVSDQIDGAIVTPVNNWLAAHIRQPTTPVVDNTLSIATAAADAERTGNLAASVYDDTATYAVGDYVLYNGKIRRCVQAIATPESFVLAHWETVNACSELKKLYSDIKNGHIIPSSYTQHLYIDWNNGFESAYAGDDLSIISGFIEIPYHTKTLCLFGIVYNSDNLAGIAFYDASHSYISGIKLYHIANQISVPASAVYFKATIPTDVQTVFSYDFITDPAALNTSEQNINNMLTVLNNTKLSAVNPDDCTFITKGKNLIDPNSVIHGYYVDAGTGNLYANADFWVTPLIKIEPSQAYTLRYKNQGAQYDADAVYIDEFTTGYSNTTTAAPSTATTQATAVYVRVCGSSAQLSSDQLEKGSSVTYYEPFTQLFNNNLVPFDYGRDVLINKILRGEGIQVKLVGDSITHGVGGTGFAEDGAYIGDFFGQPAYRNPNGYCWANLFAAYLVNELNCTVVNNAVKGTSFNELNSSFNTLIDSSDDLVICMYGTNNRIGGYDTLRTTITSIVNKCKAINVPIIMLTPIPASVTDEEDRTYHIEQICNMIKSTCIELGVPCLDTNQIMQDYCEYRNVTIDTLLADGLHPNDNGYTILYNSVCKVLGITRPVTGATW